MRDDRMLAGPLTAATGRWWARRQARVRVRRLWEAGQGRLADGRGRLAAAQWLAGYLEAPSALRRSWLDEWGAAHAAWLEASGRAAGPGGSSPGWPGERLSPGLQAWRRMAWGPAGLAGVLALGADLRDQQAGNPALAALGEDLDRLLGGVLDDACLRLRAQSYAFVHPALPATDLLAMDAAACDDPAGRLPKPGEPANAAGPWVILHAFRAHPAMGAVSGHDAMARVLAAIEGVATRARRCAARVPLPGLDAWVRSLAGTAWSQACAGWPCASRWPLGRADTAEGAVWWEAACAAHAGEGLADADRRFALHLAARHALALDERGRPRDPVARFHYASGARLEGLHWEADAPATSLARLPIVASYGYEPAAADRRRAALAMGAPARSDAVVAMLAARGG